MPAINNSKLALSDGDIILIVTVLTRPNVDQRAVTTPDQHVNNDDSCCVVCVKATRRERSVVDVVAAAAASCAVQ